MPEMVRAPRFALVAKRFVVDAVVVKSVVEVAFVVVEFSAVKFWRVVELFAWIMKAVTCPVEVKVPPLPVVKKRFVVEATVAKMLVVVA